jgi:hypothetical protein
MSFSKRLGLVKVDQEIQLNEMSDQLRIGLWNIFYDNFGKTIEHSGRQSSTRIRVNNQMNILYFEVFKKPLDSISDSPYTRLEFIKDSFFTFSWNEVYDFIEFIAKSTDFESHSFEEACNYVLKRDLSGYRFIDSELVPITDPTQIGSIQDALDVSNKLRFNAVRIHLTEALRMLSIKPTPDYRNSIKESISAVESLTQKIAGDKPVSLGKALGLISAKIDVHKALLQGYNCIYGYTSDGDGIRHGLMDEPNVDLEDALYMLVSCSAFINYLVIKADKAGISIS